MYTTDKTIKIIHPTTTINCKCEFSTDEMDSHFVYSFSFFFFLFFYSFKYYAKAMFVGIAFHVYYFFKLLTIWKKSSIFRIKQYKLRLLIKFSIHRFQDEQLFQASVELYDFYFVSATRSNEITFNYFDLLFSLLLSNEKWELDVMSSFFFFFC